MSTTDKSQNLINQFLPKYRLRQVDRIRLSCSPEKAWDTIRNFDTYDLAISKFLFNLRVIPEQIFKRFRGQKVRLKRHSRINDFTGAGKGFQILAEEPGREIVIGSIGKFWKLNIEYAEFDIHKFQEFRKPGYGKLVWNLRLDPDSQSGSWLTWELRVTSTDDSSWSKFRKYWFLIGNFSHLLRRMALKDFQYQLGQGRTDEELKLPGDSFLETPHFQKTMAKIVEVQPAKLWPWLVQMGCQRAGWYSIDRLDNGGIKSATRIVPELQNIKVGDILPWRPTGKEGFAVLSVDKNRSLVLGSPSLLEDSQNKFANTPMVDSWAFVLEPIGSDATYLTTRVRGDVKPGEKHKIMEFGLGVAHYVMEKAQLKNLKQRAERQS